MGVTGVAPEILTGAKLVLVVGPDGAYQWCSPLSRARVAKLLAGIAEDIEMGPGPGESDD